MDERRELIARKQHSTPVRRPREQILHMEVVGILIVRERNLDTQSALEPLVKEHQVRIGVVEQRLLWAQSQRDCQAAAKRLNETAMAMRCPHRSQMRNLPALAASPLQRRAGHDAFCDGDAHSVLSVNGDL